MVADLSSTLLDEQPNANGSTNGRILVKGTPSRKTLTFRNDPYRLRVLENRDYPTPVYSVPKPFLPAPTTVTKKVVAAAPQPIAPTPEAAAPKPTLAVVEAAAPLPAKQEAKTANNSARTSPRDGAKEEAAAPQHHSHPRERNGHVKDYHNSPSVCRVVIEFKRGEDVYASHLDHHLGDMVVVEGDRGHDMGRVIEVLPVKGPSIARVMHIATQKDRDTLTSLRKEEAAAVRLCQQRVKEHNLKMKIEDVEFQYDGGKITIYYSSSVAVDFRQLQRQLFRDFRCRVWLRTVPASTSSS
jgi:hypothetical protein